MKHFLDGKIQQFSKIFAGCPNFIVILYNNFFPISRMPYFFCIFKQKIFALRAGCMKADPPLTSYEHFSFFCQKHLRHRCDNLVNHIFAQTIAAICFWIFAAGEILLKIQYFFRFSLKIYHFISATLYVN